MSALQDAINAANAAGHVASAVPVAGAIPGQPAVAVPAPVPVAPAIPAGGFIPAPLATGGYVPQPVASIPVAPAVAPAPVAPAAAPAPLGGGNRLNDCMNMMKTTTAGSMRNDLVVGTGIFLFTSAKFSITEMSKKAVTSLSFLCLAGSAGSNGIAFGTAGYDGPMPGEEYNHAIWQDAAPKKFQYTLKNNLRLLATCLGWSDAKLKEAQATNPAMVYQYIAAMSCVNIVDMVPTGQPSMFSNQIILQISTKVKNVQSKNAATGQPNYDATGQIVMESYTNSFFDRKVPIAEAIALIGEEATVRAFGSTEAVVAAAKAEQELAAMQ